MTAGRHERLLRWYPPAWRERYGEELLALMEDTYGERGVPARGRAEIVRAGLRQRLEPGSAPPGPADRVRSGALLVLWAWVLVVVAGTGYAKFVEHWDVATPTAHRWLPAAAYGTVQAAAGLGAAVLATGALVALPAFVRFLRGGGWPDVRRPVVRAVALVSAAVVVTATVVLWSHAVGPAARATGSTALGVVGALWGALLLAALAAATGALVAVVRRLELSATVLRFEGWLAVALTALVLVVLAGVVLWWAAIATWAPAFLTGSGLAAGHAPAPPALVAGGLLLLAGAALAVAGTVRVLRAIAALRPV